MRILILTSLFVLCTSLNSCQKEFGDSIDPISTTSDFRAKINGVQFVADISAATVTDSTISLQGISNDGQKIVFNVADSGVHVYTLDIISNVNLGSFIMADSLVYTSGEGTVPAESGGNLAIVSMDPVKRLMSGTFNFKAFRQQDGIQKTITEGSFNNISY